jgi:uncharacterized protein (TIGR02246 family)
MNRLLLVALLAIGGTPVFGQESQSAVLQPFIDRYVDVWNSHDAHRLADFFAEDSDILVGIAPIISGRPAVEDWWGGYFSRIDDGRLLDISIDSIRFLASDVAIVNLATTTGGVNSKTGETMETRRARGTWVVIRRNGEWKIDALRAHSPVGEERIHPGTDR